MPVLGAGYGQLPIAFEPNQGQADAEVQFLAHGPGYGLFLTPTEAVLSLATAASAGGDSAPPAPISMQLVGAAATAQGAAQDPLGGVSNYLIGADPSKWITGVVQYGRVHYQNVYAGVSVDYHGSPDQLQYDFTVAPGADPGQIKLNFAGADEVGLDAEGNLQVRTGSATLVNHAPVLFQTIGGVQHAVAGSFALLGGTEVGFSVGAYDATRELVIDPTLAYSTYLGGSGTDWGLGVAVDSAGSAYVTGVTTSTNLPGANRTGTITGATNSNPVVVTSPGHGLTTGALITISGVGGNAAANGNRTVTVIDANTFSINVAGNGSYAGGGTWTRIDNGVDAFVTKLNAAGTARVYSTYIGGSGDDRGYGIAVDSSGSAYVTGWTSSTNLPTTAGAPQPSYRGGSFDSFVTKLNAIGR
jgi:hypothetical protein